MKASAIERPPSLMLRVTWLAAPFLSLSEQDGLRLATPARRSSARDSRLPTTGRTTHRPRTDWTHHESDNMDPRLTSEDHDQTEPCRRHGFPLDAVAARSVTKPTRIPLGENAVLPGGRDADACADYSADTAIESGQSRRSEHGSADRAGLRTSRRIGSSVN